MDKIKMKKMYYVRAIAQLNSKSAIKIACVELKLPAHRLDAVYRKTMAINAMKQTGYYTD